MSLLWPIVTQAVRRPAATAVIDDRGRWSYIQVVGGAMTLAEKIDSTVSAKNVGVMLPTSGAFPVALLGAWLAGRVVVPLNYLLAKEELRYVIRDSQVDTVVTSKLMLDFLGNGEGDGGSVIPEGVNTLMMESVDFTGLPPLRWPPRPRDDQPAVILYTSGTSGKPKGVVLSHGNLHSNVEASITHAAITEVNGFLGVLPNFHSFGLTALTLMPLRAGAKVIYTARFIPKRIVNLIKEHRPDIIMLIPSMYTALLSVKEAVAEDFSSVRFAVSGGEPLPDAVYEQFQNRFNVQLLEGYGLTETSPVLTWSTPQRHKRKAVGQAVPGVEVLIVDEHDKPLPPKHDGEILVAGPNIMQGYFGLSELTKQAFTQIEMDSPDGVVRRQFFRTGDIGHLDDDNYLFITGRKKEMLKVGGEIVFPREVEEALNRNPAVKASAVIGRTDPVRGEVPVAFIEVADGSTFNENQLKAWCRENLAGYKVPREIREIEKLPRNATGKILKRELKAE